MSKMFVSGMAVVGLLALMPASALAQGHVEVDDAGSVKSGAQTVYGSGPLLTIQGSLSPARSGRVADFEDMYLIRITDPGAFSMRTDAAGGGSASFDTEVWLFESAVGPNDAFGLLANDEISGGSAGPSLLLSPADDGTGQTIPTPGLYLVAISGFDRDPHSAGGAVFDQASRTEISGPDGAGAGDAHTGWSGAGETGTYTIALTGAAFVEVTPTITEWGLVAMAVLLLAAGATVIRRQRRCARRVSG